MGDVALPLCYEVASRYEQPQLGDTLCKVEEQPYMQNARRIVSLLAGCALGVAAAGLQQATAYETKVTLWPSPEWQISTRPGIEFPSYIQTPGIFSQRRNTLPRSQATSPESVMNIRPRPVEISQDHRSLYSVVLPCPCR